MNSSVYRLRLDLHEATAQDCVVLNKGETTRRIEIELYENNAPWEFTENVTVAICISGDDTIYVGEEPEKGIYIKDNKVIYEALGELTGTVGIREVQLRIMESVNTSVDPDEPNTDKLLYAPKFTAIINDVVNDGTTAEEEARQARQGNLIAQINAVIEKADEGGFDGEKGDKGDQGNPGYSPTVTVENIPNGHRVTITDEQGPHAFNVMDGSGGTSDVPVFVIPWYTNPTTEQKQNIVGIFAQIAAVSNRKYIVYLNVGVKYITAESIKSSFAVFIDNDNAAPRRYTIYAPSVASYAQTDDKRFEDITFDEDGEIPASESVIADYVNGKLNALDIPSKTSDLENDSDFVSADELSEVATSGDYDDLSNKPTIPTVPTNVSAFNNDAGYITDKALSFGEITSSMRTLKFYENKHPDMSGVQYGVQGMGFDGEYIYVNIRSYFATDNSYPSLLRKIRASDGVVVDYIPYNTAAGIHVGHGGDIACRNGKLFFATGFDGAAGYYGRSLYVYDSDFSAYYTGERVSSSNMLYYLDGDTSHFHIPSGRAIQITDALFGFTDYAATVGGFFDKDGNAVSWSDVTIGSVAYDAVNDLFIVGLNNDVGTGLKLYDSKRNIYRLFAYLRYTDGVGSALGSFEHVITIGCYDLDLPYIAQGTDADDKYIYQCYSNQDTPENYIVVFDHDGNYLYKYKISETGELEGCAKTVDGFFVNYIGGVTSGETVANLVIDELTVTYEDADKYAPAGAILKLEREIQNALYIDSEVTI